MDKREVAQQFKEKTESGNWSRRSLVSWLGKGCVLALAGRGVTACGEPTAEVSSSPTWSSCDEEGFRFEPSNCDILAWAERTVDPQELENILAGWRLSVGGMVENEFSLSFDLLVAMTSHNPIVDFHCVEGWSVLDVPWNGVRLRDLLAQAVVRSPATHVNFHTIGGEYNESLPLEVALERNTILAYGIDGSSLSMRHGFPARVVIPRLFGYKSAKFVERIELSDSPLVGFWVARGYPYDGEVTPERLREGKY